MNIREMLEKKLSACSGFDAAQVVYIEKPLGGVNPEKLAEAFLNVGRLMERDEETGVLVGVIAAGAAGLNEAVLAAVCCDGVLAVCASAREGIVNQGTTLQAVDKLLIALGLCDPRPASHARWRQWVVPVLIATTALVLVIVAIGLVNPAVGLTRNYNEAVHTFNDLAAKYNERVASVSVENVEGFPAELGSLASADESWPAVALSLMRGNSVEKIASDTKTVDAASDVLRYDLAIVAAIDNPSASSVEQALDRVDGIDAMEATSADNDPNEMLGKEGGYSSCVYFTLDLLADQVQDAGPVAMGVDGGGAIEVFPALADAEARCDYLAEFDNSILESGSYALVGTMVVRTSRLLSADEQLRLTNAIVTALTDIEG